MEHAHTARGQQAAGAIFSKGHLSSTCYLRTRCLGWNSAMLRKKGTSVTPCMLCTCNLSVLERRRLVSISIKGFLVLQCFSRQHRTRSRHSGESDSVSDIVQSPFSRNGMPIQSYFLSPPSKLATWTVYWLNRANFTTAIIVCPERTLPLTAQLEERWMHGNAFWINTW